MKCIFCNSECLLSHKENSDQIQVHDCIRCPVLVCHHIEIKTGDRVKTVFVIDKNQRVYTWTDHHRKNFSYITDLLVKDGRDPIILKFPKLMNAKPENVRDKFKFYMLFS